MQIESIPVAVAEIVKKFKASKNRPFVIQITGKVQVGKSLLIRKLKESIDIGLEFKPKYFKDITKNLIQDAKVVYIHTWSGEPANSYIIKELGRNVDVEVYMYKDPSKASIPKNRNFNIILWNNVEI